jgi:hypothetical protein
MTKKYPVTLEVGTILNFIVIWNLPSLVVFSFKDERHPAMLTSVTLLVAYAAGAQASFAKVPRQSNGTTANPIVVLNYGTFRGSSSNGVDSFLGIPFAQPP